VRATTWLATVAVLMGLRCSPRYVLLPDGAYDYRVPVVASDETDACFARLLDATVRVTLSPKYRTYHYNHDYTSESGVRLSRPEIDRASPTGYRLAEGDGLRVTEDAYSKVGAGLLLIRASAGEGFDAAVVMTAGHLVTSPDTLKVYSRDVLGRETPVLERVSVKVDALVFVTGRTGVNLGATVQKLDRKSDLALLTLSIPWQHAVPSEFDFELGQLSDLKWGNFVFVVGYPLGAQRVTGGMVSLDPQTGRFNLDAAVRPGYSGGPVIAVRDGLPHFELVGLCRGIAMQKRLGLSPHGSLPPGTVLSPDLLDRVVVEELEVPEYGLGIAVAIDAMRTFVQSSRGMMARKGIDVDNETLLRMWGM